MQLRLYVFVNYYLSSIQQGIQAGHVAVNLVRKYTQTECGVNGYMVRDWADNHKTFVVLNGGNCENILENIRLVDDSDLPWAYFREDEVSLGGLITAVGVIVPENLFNVKTEVARMTGEKYFAPQDVDGKSYPVIISGDPMYDFVYALKNARLAQ